MQGCLGWIGLHGDFDLHNFDWKIVGATWLLSNVIAQGMEEGKKSVW